MNGIDEDVVFFISIGAESRGKTLVGAGLEAGAAIKSVAKQIK
jgi:hypothetical protein